MVGGCDEGSESRLAAVDSGRKNCCGIYRIGDVQHGSRPAPSRRGIVSGLRPTCNRSRRVVWRMLTWISYRTPLGSRRNDLIERHSSRRSRANWVPFAAAVFLRRRPRSHHLTQRFSCRSHPRSLLTRWWREVDSNHRSPSGDCRRSERFAQRSRKGILVLASATIERLVVSRGTDGSNPVPSSGESVSLPERLSRVENPGFPRGCARLAWRPGRQRHAGCHKIAPTGGNISVAPYSSTAVPLMGSPRMPRRSQ